MSGRVFLGLTSTKQRVKYLAQGQKAVTPVTLEPATPRSPDKYSTTEPLCSHIYSALWKFVKHTQAIGGCTYAIVFRAKNGRHCRMHHTRGRNFRGKYIFCLFDLTD